MAEDAEPRLRACFRRLPGAVLLLSADGVVVDSNGALERELGRVVRGRSFADALDPGSSARKWARILTLAAPGAEEGEVVWELVLRGRDALLEPRPFSVLWDAEGRVFWLLEHRPDPRLDDLREQVTGVNSELANTQRALLKERGRLAHALTDLARSNEALDEFAHVVSHDLQAPLRSVVSYASWLEEDLGDALTGEAREHLRRLRQRAERMKSMIRGVLEYARAGRARARPEPVRVDELIRDVVELLDPPAAVEIHVDPGMPTVVTERAPLQQVFLNLIGNAVRYAKRDDPRIRVGVREAGGVHEFSVADNGPGIPAAARERIWTLFHTLEPEERAEGTGIGLAVVRKLVEGQGGRVWVESEPGAGATFRFTWPRAGRQENNHSA